MKTLGKWRLGVALAALAIAAGIIGLRRTPAFAAAVELPVYDRLVVSYWPWKPAPSPAIALVTMSEEGFWRGLDDAKLADLLERIRSAKPTVIGVDLIRDNPLPPGIDRLRTAVLSEENGTTVFMSCGLPGAPGAAGFQAPAFLRDPDNLLDHVGLAVMPEDSPGRPMVRRGLAAVNGGALLTLPAQAAINHLAARQPQRLEALFTRLEEISSLPPDAGGYAGKSDAGNQFLLKPIRGIAALYPAIPAEEIASMPETELEQHFAGKIVFVGTEASLSQDEKPVAGNPNLRGIRLIAHTTAQLLRELDGGENPVGWTPWWIEDLAILVAAALCALLCAGIRGPLWLRIVTVVPLLCGAWWLVGAWMLVKNGLWLPVGAPLAATALTGISTHALMFLHERRDRRTMFSLMERHLSPEVADTIWQNNESLLAGHGTPPEIIVGTALFADLKGYSGITGEFQKSGRDREFIAWLNRYLQAIIPLIRAEHGFVQQFAGDGVFVIFGFPATRGGHAAQAVRCARAIAAAVAELNLTGDPALPLYFARVGIYTGEIICGTVGDSSHASYSFFGGTINKAARLESLRKDVHDTAAEPVRILASAPTRAADSTAMEPFLDGPLPLDPNLPPEIVWKVLL